MNISYLPGETILYVVGYPTQPGLICQSVSLEDTGWGGGIPRAHQKKVFGAIPYFLVIADFENFLYVAQG